MSTYQTVLKIVQQSSRNRASLRVSKSSATWGCAKIVKKKTCLYPPLPFFQIFRGWVSEIIELSYSAIYCIYILGTPEPCFYYWSAVYGICMIGYIMASCSCSFVCILQLLIIIIMQTYLKSLNCQNVFQVYAAECVSTFRKIILIIFLSIYGAVCLRLTHFSYVDCENVYCILSSSSNRKYESFTIVEG